MSTFRQISRDILQPRCVTCHSGPNPASAIDLTAFAGAAGQVQAGNPGASTLWQAVSSGSMPPGGPRLSPADVKKIGDWITAGARNN